MKHSATSSTDARNVRVDAFVAQMEQAERAAVVEAIQRRELAELERAAIAARIKQARNEAGLSQPEMAEALDVIPRTYQNYESQKDPRTPWGLMNQIATVTGKSTEWLIHGDARSPTPDLLGADGGLQEGLADLRGEVEALRAELRAEREAQAETIQAMLAEQSQLLRDITALLSEDGMRLWLEYLSEVGLPDLPETSGSEVAKLAKRSPRRAAG